MATEKREGTSSIPTLGNILHPKRPHERRWHPFTIEPVAPALLQFLYHAPTNHFLSCSKSFSLRTPQDAPKTSPDPPIPETYVHPQNAFCLLTMREFRSRSWSFFYYRSQSFLSRTRQGICIGGGYFSMLITCPTVHTHTSPAPPFIPKCRPSNILLR